MRNPLKIFWFNSDRFGCGSYRCLMPALTLQEKRLADSDFMLHTDVRDPFNYQQLEDCDVIVFQRPIGTLFSDIMKWAKARGIKCVYEMDDLLFNIPKHNPAHEFYQQKQIQRLLQRHLQDADEIIVSTRILADEVGEYTYPSKIHICPNHLHPDIWGEYPDDRVYENKGLVIGWQGSATHEVDFRQCIEALARLIKETKDDEVTIRFVGNVPECVKGVIPFHRFQYTKGVRFEMYPALMKYANLDIGLAPLVDSRFNRSKSNVKWIEYSAIGVPCVASNVGPYAESIQDGVTGFLVNSVEEWYSRLKELVSSVELRKKIGQQAKQHVWNEYSNLQAIKWLSVFVGAPWQTLVQFQTLEASPNLNTVSP